MLAAPGSSSTKTGGEMGVGGGWERKGRRGGRKGGHQSESRRKQSRSVEMDSSPHVKAVTQSLQLFTRLRSPNILDLGFCFSFPCSLLSVINTRSEKEAFSPCCRGWTTANTFFCGVLSKHWALTQHLTLIITWNPYNTPSC